MPLYRPVGLYELAKIAALDFRAYPPRLPEQPIFYPVLNQPYAEEIASRWNPPDPNSGFAGFVTTFVVADAAVAKFPRRIVGASRHEELRVPAEEQAWLEARFEGLIEVVAAWAGRAWERCCRRGTVRRGRSPPTRSPGSWRRSWQVPSWAGR